MAKSELAGGIGMLFIIGRCNETKGGKEVRVVVVAERERLGHYGRLDSLHVILVSNYIHFYFLFGPKVQNKLRLMRDT